MWFLDMISKIIYPSLKNIEVPKIIAPAPVPTKDLLLAARGKGTFIYEINPLIKEFGNIVGVVNKAKEMGLNHVWIRIVGKSGWSVTQTIDQAKEIVERCKSVNINVGGWGFIYDPDNEPTKYAEYVVKYVKELGLDLFVHNMEFDHEDDPLIVETEHAKKYWSVIKKELPDVGHGLSSFWHVDYHRLAWEEHSKYFDFIAPQAYHVTKESLFGFLKKVLMINIRFNKPIVLTLQGFWGEMNITEESATRDFKKICEQWTPEMDDSFSKNKLIGVNTWYFGGKGTTGMNAEMRECYKMFNPKLHN